jgi:hypothetical protein
MVKNKWWLIFIAGVLTGDLVYHWSAWVRWAFLLGIYIIVEAIRTARATAAPLPPEGQLGQQGR